MWFLRVRHAHTICKCVYYKMQYRNVTAYVKNMYSTKEGIHLIKWCKDFSLQQVAGLVPFTNLLGCIATDNNVCKTFRDYDFNRNNNRNCYFNPDTDLQQPNIITRHGYPLEIRKVTTKDGYILSLFRIPYGKTAKSKSPGKPIFLQHGLSTSSAIFYFRGNTSLAFLLADQGYDVWLGNFRGTEYSDRHHLSDKSRREYWNFSFHELGIYDLPAQLDVVAKVTRQKIIYMGHSMGTTTFFIYSTEFPDIAAKNIGLSISLAPVAYMQYIDTPIKNMFQLWPIMANVLYDTTNGSTIIRTEFTEMMRKLCVASSTQLMMCCSTLDLLFGYDDSQWDPEYLPVAFMQNFDASSIKTYTHYIQLYYSGKFRHFDYGNGNNKVYGRKTPPEYQLSRMKVPTYFIRGENDFLAPKKNVELLYSRLSPNVKPFPIYTVKYDKFSHSDFVAAKDMMQLLYNHIIDFLKTYGPNFF